MYATKRKFHNLLNSLTNNSSSTSLSTPRPSFNASTTTLPAQTESNTKKRRVERPTSEAGSPTNRPRTSHATQSSTTSITRDHKPVPNYAPWDRNQFLPRLKTFRYVDKWSAKPAAVNEVQWAKRGWSCVGKERVRCVGGCGKEVLVKLVGKKTDEDERTGEDETHTGVDDEIIRRYANMIITGHDESCLWRVRGCDDAIYRLPLAQPFTSIAALAARYKSLVAMAADLPSKPSTPDTLNLKDLLKQISEESLLTYSAPQLSSAPSDQLSNGTLNVEAFILALFGWQAETGHIAGLATCDACFRRLGLWLFKAKPSEDASMSRLDVVGEHREYCPWINPTTQFAGGSSKESVSSLTFQKAGWQVLLQVLQGALHLQTHPDGRSSIHTLDADDINDAGSDMASSAEAGTKAASVKSRDEKDKERWAKLRKLKRVFDVKSGRKKRPADMGGSPPCPADQNVIAAAASAHSG